MRRKSHRDLIVHNGYMNAFDKLIPHDVEIVEVQHEFRNKSANMESLLICMQLNIKIG